MMDDLEFSLWCDRLQLSQTTRRVIGEIRSSEPVRHRQSRVGNWTGRYISDKMGRTIQFESRTEEFLAVVSYEHDDKVIEFYDQPSKIEMRYVARSGRPVVFWHTPDFFVLRVDGAGWKEWKLQEKLVELAESMPNRYQRDEQGYWHCPPGEEYAAWYDLTYSVRSSSTLNPMYVRNLNFLEDYLRDPHLQVDEPALKVMRDLFAEEPVMTLKALLEHVEAQHVYSVLLLKHRQPLVTSCPQCQKSSPFLTQVTRPGYCSHCGLWLGNAFLPRTVETTANERGGLMNQHCASKVVGELLAGAPHLSESPRKEQVAAMMSLYVKHYAKGNISVLARLVKLNVQALWAYIRGTDVPYFDSLLRLCFALSITPLEFLTAKALPNQRVPRFVVDNLPVVSPGKWKPVSANTERSPGHTIKRRARSLVPDTRRIGIHDRPPKKIYLAPVTHLFVHLKCSSH